MPKSDIAGLVLFFVGMPIGIVTTPPEIAAYGINVFTAISLIGAGIVIGRSFAAQPRNEELEKLKDTFS